jgi:nicotinate phosphoribosyltransferase
MNTNSYNSYFDKYVTKTGEQIIPSLLYLDLYKLAMLQVYLEKFSTIWARFDLKVRSDFNFAPYLSEIEHQLDLLCTLRFLPDELEYCSKIRFFKKNFINRLRGFSMDRQYIHPYIDDNGKFQCYAEGPIDQASLYEIYVLAILIEIYTRETLNEEHFKKGEEILSDNIHKIIDYSKYRLFKYSDFSCRRAASVRWLDHIINRMSTEISSLNFVGTSCVYYAKKYNITPIGTMAHEMLELGQAIVHPFDSQEFILKTWGDVYKGDLGIALTDTFGIDYFIKKVFHRGYAYLFTGVRHDSGDPFEFGEKIINMYENFGINPMSKTLVFSDGLTFDKAFKLCDYFNERIITSFGIGTNIGNDLGVKAPQIVMKMTEAEGKPVAKISDTFGKGMCRNTNYETFIREHIRNVISY